MKLYFSQERWGRVYLHFAAALRAGHWGWHLAGIGREIEFLSVVRLRHKQLHGKANQG